MRASAAVLATLVALVLAGHATATASTRAVATAHPTAVLTAFHFRSRSHFGGLFGHRSYRSTRNRHSLLRRIAKTAFYVYLAHLFFSHGGLSILLWIVIIAFVVSLMRRRRRRRYVV